MLRLLLCLSTSDASAASHGKITHISTSESTYQGKCSRFVLDKIAPSGGVGVVREGLFHAGVASLSRVKMTNNPTLNFGLGPIDIPRQRQEERKGVPSILYPNMLRMWTDQAPQHLASSFNEIPQ
jgi:hypothetical protein